MASKVTEIPNKTYRRLLRANYKETKENARRIKTDFTRKNDPICQRGDRYIPAKKRTRPIMKNHNEELIDKPERIAIKRRIFTRNNLGSGLNVTAQDFKPRGLKVSTLQRRNDESYKRGIVNRRVLVHRNPNYLNNFYKDYSNSYKPSIGDIYHIRRPVSKINILIHVLLFIFREDNLDLKIMQY